MNEYWRWSAHETAAAVARRDVSVREVVQAALDRLAAVNPALNAVPIVLADEALREADAADRRIAAGESLPPLHGVPVTVKSNVDQRGCATSNGIPAFRDVIAADDSPVVANLRRAGAIIIGRTNVPELSVRWFTDNPLHGTTYSPWDRGVTPGGSTGGGAVAVATGIGALAHGSDSAGSVRYPAYACGVVGFKPSAGRIPSYDATARGDRPFPSQIVAVHGVLARSVDDAWRGLAAMSLGDARDPWWVPAPLEGPARPKRAAICLRPGGLETVKEVADAVVDAGKRLERAGWSVEEITDIPPFEEAADLQVKFWLADGYDAMLDAAEREGDPGALAVLRGHEKLARSLDLAAFSKMLTRRATLVRAWEMFFETWPVIVMPPCGELPFAWQLDLKDDASFRRVWRAQMPQIALPFIGMPGLTVSTGMVGRSPVGVQIVAGRYREDLCLLAGEAIEAGGAPVSPIEPVLA